MHRRIGHTNDYWSFTIIRRRISHDYSIPCRTNNASDGQIAKLTDLGRRNRNPTRLRIQPVPSRNWLAPRRRLGEVEFAKARQIVADAVGGDSVSPDMGRFER
jgi:hypothetical protein